MFDFLTYDHWLAILIAIPYGLSSHKMHHLAQSLPTVVMQKLWRIRLPYLLWYCLVYSSVFATWFLSILLFKPFVEDGAVFLRTWVFTWGIIAASVTLFLNWKNKI